MTNEKKMISVMYRAFCPESTELGEYQLGLISGERGESIRKHLVKGSVLGFDELNDRDSPGETIALAEVFGLHNVRLKRWRYVSRTAYFVVE